MQHKPCKFRKPPGKVIYEKDTLRVYEVDGKEDKVGLWTWTDPGGDAAE